MSRGPLPETGRVISAVIAPEGVIRPILSVLNSVNQRLPSEARVMLVGPLPGVGIGNSVAVTAGTHRSSSCWTVGRNVLCRNLALGRLFPNRRRTERNNRFMEGASKVRKMAFLARRGARGESTRREDKGLRNGKQSQTGENEQDRRRRKLFRAIVRGRMSSRAGTLVTQAEAPVFLTDKESKSRLP